MIKKSMTTGLIVGLLLALAGLYPAFAFFVANTVNLGESWSLEKISPVSPDGALNLTSLVWLMSSAGVITLLSLALGSLAAWRTGATCLKQGLLSGIISGATAGIILHALLVSPTAVVWAGRDLLNFDLTPEMAHFPDNLILSFVRFNLSGITTLFLPLLLVTTVIGGVEGGLVGWLRRRLTAPPAALTLLEAISQKGGRPVWFAAHKDEVLKAGLLVGLVGGGILLLSILQDISTPAGSERHEIWVDSIIQQALSDTPLQQLVGDNLAILLAPLVVLVLLGAGGIAAALPKNPPGRLGARIYAATVAGGLIGLLMAIPVMNQFYLGVTLLPQFLPTTPHADISPEDRIFLLMLASTPGRILLIYCLPPLVGAVMMALGAMWGMLQGIGYGLILMLFKFRPVDRARLVRREITRQPAQFLPRLYHLFQTQCQATQVLEHLAFELKADPDKARVIAAYHLLATRPENTAQALGEISQILNQQPTWQLRAEIGALHRVIAQGLQARSVAQIAAIAPMPEDQTRSLPPLLIQANQRLGGILKELKKIERVDDLSSKVIFLNNTLEHLRQARLLAREVLNHPHKSSPTLPDFNAFRLLLDGWEDIVLSAVKEVQGGARLTSSLKTRRLAFAPRLELTLLLANTGLNVAENIRLQVDPCQDGYELLAGQAQTIDILPPQDSRELSLCIEPAESLHLRLCWQITYNDGLQQDVKVEFADLLEFVETDRPFQHIFPIPYVTGTPLQNGQVFVGRQDIFKFIQEQLLGSYQNNVIVLHGQRRTGKTSILYRLNEVLADTHIGVLIDMQGKAARGEVDFLYSIADDITYALENRGILVELPARREFEESPEFFFRNRFLRSIADVIGNKNILLMFDEFEELQKRVEDNKLTADIFPYIRNLMQHEHRVDFIFAGTHKLEDLAAQYWSILFNIAVYRKITFLSPEEVANLVTQPVAPFNVEYDPLAIERIYQVAAGQPYFTQLICHELITYHNETQRSYLTTVDVDAVLERIIERGEAHFKYIWAESTTPQRLALLALAELLETRETATLEDVTALLSRRGRPLEGGEAPLALDNLEARDIVKRSGPRSSLYRFRIDLIRRWLYISRPTYDKLT